MNAKEKALIINRLYQAKADRDYYKGTRREKAVREVYYTLRGLAIDLGIKS